MPHDGLGLIDELVDCPECGAIPKEACTSDAGRSCKPHGKRTARLHGLKATPRRGCYSKPVGGLVYRDDETKACDERGIVLPMKSGIK